MDLRFALGAHDRDRDNTFLGGAVVPSVTGSVLNHAITGFEKHLSPVVQFQIHFTGENNVEIHGVGGVHVRRIRFEDINHARQLLLKFVENRLCAELIDVCGGIRRYGEEREAETAPGREMARPQRWSSIRREFRGGIASPDEMKLEPGKCREGLRFDRCCAR
jgi:hypothetical protein